MLQDRYTTWLDGQLQTIDKRIREIEEEISELKVARLHYGKARDAYLALHAENGTADLSSSTVVNAAVAGLEKNAETELRTDQLVKLLYRKGFDPDKRKSIVNILNQETKKSEARLLCRGIQREKYWRLPHWEVDLNSAPVLKRIRIKRTRLPK